MFREEPLNRAERTLIDGYWPALTLCAFADLRVGLCDGKVHACFKVWKPTRKHLMSKAELVAAVQKALGKEASSAQAERTVDAVIEGIKTGVKKTKSVQLVGFGTFKIATRKARIGVNPKTGEKIKIKARKTVKFVPGKGFKEIS